MTRKDYVRFAEAIATNRNQLVALQMETKGERAFEAYQNAVFLLREHAMTMAEHMKEDNPRFDRKRFLNACGFEEE